MLQDKYLPVFHVSKIHRTRLRAPMDEVWKVVRDMDFSSSWVTKVLFGLRGLPTREMNLEEVIKFGFVFLEEAEKKAFIMGLIGQFWTPWGNLQKFQAADFISFDDPRFAKATWSFEVVEQPEGITEVITETRVYCPSDRVLRRFLRYWFIVGPFSGLIRKEILKTLKRQVEGAGKHRRVE